ncbi:MAG: hypothetical protein J6V09_00010 [Clostridia bacterium]|nr:hypothetical protein [Clostridia bacterium]
MIKLLFSYYEHYSKIKQYKTDKRHFAIITENGAIKSCEDVAKIAARSSLLPLFIPISFGDALRGARRMSRMLDAPMLTPRGLLDFEGAISDSAFSLCDGPSGAILSLLSHTPAYVDIGERAARELIATISGVRGGNTVILPYEKSRMHKIKKVGVRDSDFIYVFEGLWKSVESELGYSLNPHP